MIVRLMSEGQYEVNSCLLDELNSMDNRIVDYIGKGKQKEFRDKLVKLVSTVEEKGKPLIIMR